MLGIIIEVDEFDGSVFIDVVKIVIVLDFFFELDDDGCLLVLELI